MTAIFGQLARTQRRDTMELVNIDEDGRQAKTRER